MFNRGDAAGFRQVDPDIQHRVGWIGWSSSHCRLASSALRSCGAATNAMRMAALLTTFEPALLTRVKN